MRWRRGKRRHISRRVGNGALAPCPPLLACRVRLRSTHPRTDPPVLSPVRCGCDLDNRPEGPIVAGKRRDLHVLDGSLLKTRSEMAHRALIEVNDATGSEWPHIVYLDDDFLSFGFDESEFRPLTV